ncbi:protein SCARECROW-like [Zingiber officinale]|uniref:Uncharacterized protein n=1 Tax=Zingiber officinale TaxID=94328 RepID=A0A8J5I568_ZINOF|nr:protein SCARECROW-like [Zingiber officinale]KAG6535929.1 hypothetical protein ZIOFF_000960 [Zingiber officinale]
MRDDVVPVHDAALGLLHPGDNWFAYPIAFPAPPVVPFAHHLLDGCYATVSDTPEFIDLESDVGSFDSAREERGLSMIALLLDCAVAISADNLVEANRILHELNQLASPYSASCAERVVAYFAKALASRVMNSWTGICSPLMVPHKAILSCFETFGNASPFVKFAHFTANQAILEAIQRTDRVHIVDLDIMHGLQWPALFHILATRPDGPPHVRMTAFGPSAEGIGKRLASFARRLGVPFEFEPVAKRPGDVHPSEIVARRGQGEEQAVAVHWLQHALYDAAGSDHNTMRLVEMLRPRVVTLVEQEASSARGGPFLDRFMGALHYYSVMFDALGESLPTVDDLERHRVEQGILGREIDNVVAVGGPARSGEQKFGSWRGELARRGFAQLAMSRNALEQAQMTLNLFPSPSPPGYTILHGDGTAKLGWKGTALYTASAWTAETVYCNG